MNFLRLASKFAPGAGSLALAIFLGVSLRAHAQVYITEFMAFNNATLQDDFAEFSDWIEIYNAGASGVNLLGYSLSDDPALLTKWRFPATNLPPRQFLVVFASGRDRAIPGAALHTNFKLDGDGEFLALVAPDGTTIQSQFTFGLQTADVSLGIAFVPTNEVSLLPTGTAARVFIPSSDIGTNWIKTAFDDSLWAASTTAIGFETNVTGVSYASLIGTDLYEPMFVPRRSSAYLRIPIVLSGTAPTDVAFAMRYDDGFIAYLNGVEIARRNAATSAIWNSTASNQHSNSLAVLPEMISAPAFQALLQPGSNILALHGLNRTSADLDFLISPVVAGRDFIVDPSRQRFFAAPTPGRANSPGLASTSVGMQFSQSSGSFTQAFALILSAPSAAPGTVIRYTLDRSAPVETSPIYTAPLSITNTTQVRARAFEPGLYPGPVGSASYLFISSNAAGFSSDLPVIVVHTLGGGSITGDRQAPCYLEIHEPFQGRSSLTRPAELSTRAGLQIRGSTTAALPKKPFTVEFWDEEDHARDLSPLGMPAESDWVLYAVDNAEPVLIHNPYAMELYRQLGRYAVRTRFVELYLDESGGSVATNDYNGLYVLMEKIKIGPDRVAIDRLQPSDNTPPDVTGGYLFKIDRPDPGDTGFPAGGTTVLYVDPKESEMESPERDAQQQYVSSYFAAFNSALNSPNYADPTNGYAKHIEVDAAIDFHLLNILAFNVDALVLSTYLHKPRGGKLTFGPPWDFDRSMGSLDPGVIRDKDPRVWAYANSFFHMAWWERMLSDPDFFQRWIDRYQDLRRSVFATDHLLALIDHFVAQVREAQVREAQRWPGFTTPRTGRLVTDSGYTFDFGSGGYQGEVDQMKHWLRERVAFMDSKFVAPPALSEAGGPIAPGFALSMTAPPGATIYYTLDGTDPRLPGGAISPKARVYAGPLTFPSNARLCARCRNPAWTSPTGGVNPPLSSIWSGARAETYYVSVPPLLVTEIMYHPAPPPAGSPFTAEDFEYIELKNTGNLPLAIQGYSFTNGVQFVFPDQMLAPGDFVLVVHNRAAFESRYGIGWNIAGEFAGNLDNGGERLALAGAFKEPILDFVYRDEWQPLTDGYGFSLVLTDATGLLPPAWRRSSWFGGSPGDEDPPGPEVPPIVINEILSYPPQNGDDAIELFNPTAHPVDISGWYVTDNADIPDKFQFRAGTIIPEFSYRVFSDNTIEPGPGGGTRFALSRNGDEVFLFSTDGQGVLTGYRTGAAFGAAEAGVSFGFIENNPNLLPREIDYVPQISRTLGGPNSGAKIGPLVISELMYHPPDVFANGAYWNNAEEEFVELRNVTAEVINLFDPDFPGNTWRLQASFDYRFPQNATLAPQGHLLVVNFDPARETNRAQALRTKYEVDASVPIYGPAGAKLGNASGDVRLSKPGTPDPADLSAVPDILVDRVEYRGEFPWPLPAAGSGYSLQRLDPGAYGNNPANWIAAAPTAGRANAPGGGVAPGIAASPQDVTVVGGQSASFFVTATGPGPWHYQWLLDGQTLPGRTESSLLITNASEADAGSYVAVVYTANAFAASAPARLVLIPRVRILIPPENQTVDSGSNALFSATAVGTGSIRYQWNFEGNPIPNGTNASLQLPNVSLVDHGVYTLTVRDDLSETRSEPVFLTVWVRPIITLQPQPTTALVGQTVTFSLSAYGTPPIAYRWRRETTSLGPYVTNNARMIFATLTLTNVQLTDSATYSAQILNPAQATASFTSLVRLTVLPDNDHDGMADDWELANQLLPGDPTDAARDDDGDGYTNREEYQAGTDPHLADSRFLLSPPSLANGRAVLSFNASSNRTYSLQFRESLARGEWMTVTNVASRNTARLEVLTDPYPVSASRLYRLVTPQQPVSRPGPIILQQPGNVSVAIGSAAGFTVLAAGTSRLNYQWQHDGVAMPGQTAAQLLFPSVQVQDAGSYTVIVSDQLGSTTTLPAILEVQPGE